MEYWRTQLPKMREAMADLREALADETDPDETANLEANIKTAEELCNKIATALSVVHMPGVPKSGRAQMTERNG